MKQRARVKGVCDAWWEQTSQSSSAGVTTTVSASAHVISSSCSKVSVTPPVIERMRADSAADIEAIDTLDNDGFIEYIKGAYADDRGSQMTLSRSRRPKMFHKLSAIVQRHPRYNTLTRGFPIDAIVVSNPTGSAVRFMVVNVIKPRGVRISIKDALHPRSWNTCVHSAARATIQKQLNDFRDRTFAHTPSVRCPLSGRILHAGDPDIDVDHYRKPMVTMFKEWLQWMGLDYRKIVLRSNLSQMGDMQQKMSWYKYHKAYCEKYPVDALMLTDASANRSKGARGAPVGHVRAGIRRERSRALGREAVAHARDQ